MIEKSAQNQVFENITIKNEWFTIIDNCLFKYVNFKDCIFKNTIISRFENCEFDNSFFNGNSGTHKHNQFINCDFKNIDNINENLINITGSSFKNCDLSRVNFNYIISNNVLFYDCIKYRLKIY